MMPTIAMIININLFEEMPFLERPSLCHALLPLELHPDGMRGEQRSGEYPRESIDINGTCT